MLKAPHFLHNAANLMDERGKERDNEGERSMARCVAAFNAMTGHTLTEEDGWQFMVYLKHSRARGGAFRMDDYEDAVAYQALAAESAAESEMVRKLKAAAKTLNEGGEVELPSLEGLLPPKASYDDKIHIQGHTYDKYPRPKVTIPSLPGNTPRPMYFDNTKDGGLFYPPNDKDT